MSTHIASPSRHAQPPLAPVEQSRADFYALIASLLRAPPDAGLLERLGDAHTVSSPDASPFERAWLDLIGAARRADPAGVAAEHARLFAAPAGQAAAVDSSAARDARGHRRGEPRATLPANRHDPGLARHACRAGADDPLGSLCEAMRLLIAGAPGVPRQGIARQRLFFDTRLAGAVPACLDDLRQAQAGGFHARLADFVEAFFAVEAHAFAIDDAPPCRRPAPALAHAAEAAA
ncbi:MAG TPA: molecular chaperone TorD family protein [Burkholderiales bacterium]|nr:molecular chaperone TorD family protein [Burkholderiales bacterium]